MAAYKITGVNYLILDKHFTRNGNPSYNVIVVYKRGGSQMYYKQYQLRCYKQEIPSEIRAKMELPKTTKIGEII